MPLNIPGTHPHAGSGVGEGGETGDTACCGPENKGQGGPDELGQMVFHRQILGKSRENKGEDNRSSHLGKHKQTNACWSLPR